MMKILWQNTLERRRKSPREDALHHHLLTSIALVPHLIDNVLDHHHTVDVALVLHLIDDALHHHLTAEGVLAHHSMTDVVLVLLVVNKQIFDTFTNLLCTITEYRKSIKI